MSEKEVASGRPTPTPGSPSESQFLHYGDIIQVFTKPPTSDTAEPSPSTVKLDMNERTFLVDYIDDDHLRLVDTTTLNAVVLRLDDNGHLQEPSSIQRIDLLTRAKEPGYARQKGLLPEQWVDIFFVGITDPLTGKITHLEEDQIEVTLHPSQEIIYIDFSYRGLPEDLHIEKFVLRSAPSVARRAEAETEAEEEEDQGSGEEGSAAASATPSIEYTPDNEVMLFLPESIEYDVPLDQTLQEQYLEADELFFGKDRNVVEQYVEQEQYEMVFNIETQLTSLMNELLAEIPNAQRSLEVTQGIHRLLDRFRELREAYSLVDPYTHQIQGVRVRGTRYKPLLEHVLVPETVPLAWLMPVTQTRRNMYYLADESAGDFTEPGDTVLLPLDVEPLADAFRDYKNDAMHGVVNPYRHWMETLDPYFHPVSGAPLTTYDDMVPRKSVLTVFTVANDRWESVVDNAVYGREFSASAAASQAKYTALKPTTFLVQRFSDAATYMERSEDNRRVFHPRRMGYGEPMAVQSWLTLPASVAQFSRVHLPALDIMHRTLWGSSYWLKFRSLGQSGGVTTFVVDDLDADYFSTLAPRKAAERRGAKERAAKTGILTKNFMRGMQNYTLDPTLMEETPLTQDMYRSFLNTIFPATFDLVELVQTSWSAFEGLNVRDFLAALEPFAVTMDSLPYPAFNRIRYFMGKRAQAYKEQFYARKEGYRKLEQKYERLFPPSHVTHMMEHNLARQLLDKGTLYEIFLDAYRLFKLHADRPWMPTSASEIIQEFTQRDYGALFTLLMRNATLHHVVADAFLKAAAAPDDADDGLEDEGTKVPTKNGKCSRYFLTKRYTSLADLQKDNYQDDVFYDPEFDDTPYSLLNEYKADMPTTDKADGQKSQAMREFLDLLTVSLTQKHGIAKEAAGELAQTLVVKKKRVKEGEYAMLDVVSKKDSETEGAPPEREFYRRVKNKWVRDTSVLEESFADLSYLIQAAFPTGGPKKAVGSSAAKQFNQAWCDAQPMCFKNPRLATCDPFASAERRIQQMRQQVAVQEMASRLEMSQEDMAQRMETWVLQASRLLVAKERLRTVTEQKYSRLAHALGAQMARARAETPSPPASPYTKLRDDILGQSDFAKRQHDLVRFFQTGALRRAMTEELGEDAHWLYCTQTNTKLLPAFFHDLAKEYVTQGEPGYQARLEELTQFQMLSDDGDAIVDKHSGYILTKIEWVNEELYDEHGFRIKTASALVIPPEESGAAAAADPWSLPDKGTAVATVATDTELHQMVKNVYHTFYQAMELPPATESQNDLRGFVLRTVLELHTVLVKPRDEFIRDLSLRSNEPAAKLAAKYKTYEHQYMIILTMAALLVGIQTSLPPIRTKKTVPGCVKSFTGYPLTESTEDQSGILYLVCILQLVKSSVPPWNSVKNIKKETIQEMLRKTLERILETRKDVYDLYQRQFTYRAEHPDEFAIPERYQLETWRHLLPPIVEIGVLDRLPVPGSGGPSLSENPLVLQSQAIRYGYGVVEAIHRVVRSKEVLLKTSVGVPFIQNACCNDTAAQETTLQYFMRESPVLVAFLRNMEQYQKRLDQVRRQTQAPMYLFSDDTRLVRPEVTSGPAEELIYAAFIHFCQFDRLDQDIPEYLLPVCATKPAAERYAPRGSLAEKIQALKQMGRKYSWEDYDHLIRRVNVARRVHVDIQFTPPTAVKVLTEFLAVGQAMAGAGPLRLDTVRQELLAVLVKYDPQIMLLEHPRAGNEGDKGGDTDGMQVVSDALVNVLGPYNEAARERIVQFVPKGTQRDFADRVLSQWTEWGATGPTDLQAVAQFMKNTMVFLVKILPTMIFNRQFYKEWRIPKHWEMGAKHQEVITTFLNKNRGWFARFASPDPEFASLIQEWQAALLDTVRLMQLLPVQAPIDKAGQRYFRLFSETVVQELLKFVGYSLFDQVVLLCHRLPKTSAGTKTKQTATQWMVAMMEMLYSDKKIANMSYADIMREVEKSRFKEKARIMRTFQEATESDRRYMYMEKVFKLNRWSVNAKDLLKENDAQFEKEVAEFVDDTVEERFGAFSEDQDDPDYDYDDQEDPDEVHNDDNDDNEGGEDEYDEGDRELYEYDNEDAY